jgi:hypothetical protein
MSGHGAELSQRPVHPCQEHLSERYTIEIVDLIEAKRVLVP